MREIVVVFALLATCCGIGFLLLGPLKGNSAPITSIQGLGVIIVNVAAILAASRLSYRMSWALIGIGLLEIVVAIYLLPSALPPYGRDNFFGPGVMLVTVALAIKGFIEILCGLGMRERLVRADQ